MKLQNILVTLALLLSTALYAQDIQWQKTFGGVHADYLYDAVPTLDYGFIMVGGTLSKNTGDVNQSQGDFDYFITKISENGQLEWATTIGGEKTDIIKSITKTYEGGYLIAGISNSAKKNNKTTEQIGQQDIWLVKIDLKGTVEWQKTLGGIANENVADVIKIKDGYLIAATSASEGYYENKKLAKNSNLILKQGTNYGNLDYWLVKIDLQGKEVWQRTIGGIYKDELKKVIQLPNDEIVIAGVSNSPLGNGKHTVNNGLNDWWVIKLNKQGQTIWEKSYGTEGDDKLTSMLLTKDKQILLGGTNSSQSKDNNTNSDFNVLKINTDGDKIWENTYSEGTKDYLTDMIQNRDGTILLSGYTASTSNNKSKKASDRKGIEDYNIIKINAKGEEQWRKQIGTDKKEVLRKSIRTRDGGYVLMGSSMPKKATGTNNANFWVVKLLDKDKPTYTKAALESMPNPTTEKTTVVIGNAYKEGVLTVVDYAGRVLQNKKITGARILPINLGSYADGIYIINVKTDTEENSVKIIKVSN